MLVIFNEARGRENCQVNVLSAHVEEVAFYVTISKQGPVIVFFNMWVSVDNNIRITWATFLFL